MKQSYTEQLPIRDGDNSLTGTEEDFATTTKIKFDLSIKSSLKI